MFKWRKMGLIFEPGKFSDRPWMADYAQAPCSLVYDDFVRVYFSCRPEPDDLGRFVSYSAFVDLDRKDLTKVIRVSENPILPLGELGDFDEFGVYPTSVVRVGDKVNAYYGGWTRCESVPFNVAIGLAISDDDGITFRRAGKGPVLSYSVDEPFVLSGPKIRRYNDQYFLFYIAGQKWILGSDRPEPVYKIRLATSNDGVCWNKLNKDLIESRIEEDEAQASPDVIFSNGGYHMFFCFRHSLNYRGFEGGYRIGYARSKNLIDWERDDSQAGIDVSFDGWDSEMISYPHVLELDGKTWMFYLGNQVGRAGFGLAQLIGELS